MGSLHIKRHEEANKDRVYVATPQVSTFTTNQDAVAAEIARLMPRQLLSRADQFYRRQRFDCVFAIIIDQLAAQGYETDHESIKRRLK